MRISAITFATLAWIASSVGVFAGLPSREEALLQSVTPNRYIVEFENADSMRQAGFSKRSDETLHEMMYRNLRSRGISFSIDQEYTADIFIGASITVSSDADLESLASAQGILNIMPVRLVALPDRHERALDGWNRNEATRQSSQTAQIANSSAFAGQIVPADLVRNTGFSYLPQIGADRVQAAGNKGRGVKIGIIDGGIDYTRTPLGGCFGPGCKVAGGYDFVGDAYNGGNTPVPDADPISKCDSHGTTTAGIIGANDNEFGVPGVAPEATLYAYRTYGCTGSASEDVIFQAMQRAYADDVDIVNLSLGIASGWTNSALSVMASRLVSAGIVVTAAAGNSLAAGPFLGSAPATGRGVIGAGASNSTFFPAHNATTSRPHDPIRYYNFRDFLAGSYQVVTYPNDPYGCNPAEIDLFGKLIVVRNGGPCDALTKARAAYNWYADRILFVQEEDDIEPEYNDFQSLDNAEVSKADGDWLFANANSDLTITFSYNPAPQNNYLSGGLGSYFSGQGPTSDLYLVADILAPGSNIIGVAPWNPDILQRNWSITGGTSWSSAYAAGSAALYVVGKGRDLQPRKVREGLQISSNPVPFTLGNSQLLSVAHQGAGLLNIFDAINTPSSVTPTELLLNDTQFFDATQVITVTNNGRSERTYTVSNVGAGTQLTLDPTTNFTRNYPVPQVDNPARVQASRSDSSFKLKAGKSRKIELRFTAPTGLDARQTPVYSGFIQVASNGETLTVPYLGVARRMRDHPVFDSTDAYFGAPFKLPLLVDWKTNVAPTTTNPVFTFQGNDYPALYYRFNGGSQAVYLDLVRADANLGFQPTYRKRAEVVRFDERKESAPEADEDDSADWVDLRRDFTPPYVKRDSTTGTTISKRRLWQQSDLSTKLNGLQKLACKLTRNRLPFCNAQSSFAKVPVAGGLFEQSVVSRNRNNPFVRTDYQLYYFNRPNFSNGTRVPNGSYRMLLRGLKVTGDAGRNEDYESYLSPAFTIQA